MNNIFPRGNVDVMNFFFKAKCSILYSTLRSFAPFDTGWTTDATAKVPGSP